MTATPARPRVPSGTFALATLERADGRSYVALVLPEGLVDLALAGQAVHPRTGLADVADVGVLLQDWDRAFDVLSEVAEAVSAIGLSDLRLPTGVRSWGDERVLPPRAPALQDALRRAELPGPRRGDAGGPQPRLQRRRHRRGP